MILTMEELGIVADDIIHCHKDWFLAKKKQNGEHYLFGGIKSVKEIIDFSLSLSRPLSIFLTSMKCFIAQAFMALEHLDIDTKKLQSEKRRQKF